MYMCVPDEPITTTICIRLHPGRLRVHVRGRPQSGGEESCKQQDSRTQLAPYRHPVLALAVTTPHARPISGRTGSALPQSHSRRSSVNWPRLACQHYQQTNGALCFIDHPDMAALNASPVEMSVLGCAGRHPAEVRRQQSDQGHTGCHIKSKGRTQKNYVQCQVVPLDVQSSSIRAVIPIHCSNNRITTKCPGPSFSSLQCCLHHSWRAHRQWPTAAKHAFPLLCAPCCCCTQARAVFQRPGPAQPWYMYVMKLLTLFACDAEAVLEV